MADTLDVEAARARFPILADNFVFADNAGGTQVLKTVGDATLDFLINNNVEPHATNYRAKNSAARIAQAAEAVAVLLNAPSKDNIVFSKSSTQMFNNLAEAMKKKMLPSDEFVVTGEHETNVGAWTTLASWSDPPLTVHTWRPDSPPNGANPWAVTYDLQKLYALINTNTRLVALTNASNILGELLDMETISKEIKRRARQAGNTRVQIVVDMVAYAPHVYLDLARWEVDFATMSFHKFFGPHTATMYATTAALQSVDNVSFHWLAPGNDDKSSKLQIGGPGFELIYASSEVLPYLYYLSVDPRRPDDQRYNARELLDNVSKIAIRSALEHTMTLVEDHEIKLTTKLLSFLTSEQMRNRGVRVVGLETPEGRVPIVPFLVEKGTKGEPAMPSQDICDKLDNLRTIGVRCDFFGAWGLVSNLPNFSSDPNPPPPQRSIYQGLVRISLVHYNTVAEVDKITDALQTILIKPTHWKRRGC